MVHLKKLIFNFKFKNILKNFNFKCQTPKCDVVLFLALGHQQKHVENAVDGVLCDRPEGDIDVGVKQCAGDDASNGFRLFAILPAFLHSGVKAILENAPEQSLWILRNILELIKFTHENHR
jgi:hypothetical protein